MNKAKMKLSNNNCNNNSCSRQHQIIPLAISICLIGCSSITTAFQNPSAHSPLRPRSTFSRYPTPTHIYSTQLDKETESKSSSTTKSSPTLIDPSTLSAASHINVEAKEPTVLDLSSYENALLSAWDEDVTLQKGFDWEIEKLRRYFAGLRQRSDGTQSLF